MRNILVNCSFDGANVFSRDCLKRDSHWSWVQRVSGKYGPTEILKSSESDDDALPTLLQIKDLDMRHCQCPTVATASGDATSGAGGGSVDDDDEVEDDDDDRDTNAPV